MKSDLTRVFGNAAWLASSAVAQRVFGLATALYLARQLGTTGYGALGIASAFMGFAVIFMRVGTGVLGTREVARDRQRAPETYATITGLRTTLFVALAGAIAVAAPTLAARLQIPPPLLLLSTAVLLPRVFGPRYLLAGSERMRELAIYQVAPKALLLALVLLFVHDADKGLYRVPLLEASALGAAAAFFYLRLAAEHGTLPIRFRPRDWQPFLSQGSRIAASTALLAVYFDGDALLLGLLADTESAALFVVSHKLVTTPLLITTVLQDSAFPATARLVARNMTEALRLQATLLRSTLFATLAIVAIAASFAPQLVGLAYGDTYTAAAPVMRAALLSVPFFAASDGLRRILIATGNPSQLLIGSIVTVFVHLAAAYFWIPRYGAVGAAYASALGQAASTAVMTGLVFRCTGGVPWSARTLAAIVASATAWLFANAVAVQGSGAWLVAFLAGTSACTFGFGVIRRSELSDLYELVTKFARTGDGNG